MANAHLRVTIRLRPGGYDLWSIHAVAEPLVRPGPRLGPVGWIVRWGGAVRWVETVPDPFVVRGVSAGDEGHVVRQAGEATVVAKLPAEAADLPADLAVEVFRAGASLPLSHDEVEAEIAAGRLQVGTLAVVHGQALAAHPDWPEAVRRLREATAPRPGCIPGALVDLAIEALKALARGRRPNDPPSTGSENDPPKTPP